MSNDQVNTRPCQVRSKASWPVLFAILLIFWAALILMVSGVTIRLNWGAWF